jgi:hypothetical protein
MISAIAAPTFIVELSCFRTNSKYQSRAKPGTLSKPNLATAKEQTCRSRTRRTNATGFRHKQTWLLEGSKNGARDFTPFAPQYDEIYVAGPRSME